MRRLEFAARMAIIYVAGGLGLVGAKGDITAPFAVLSLFLTAELASRAIGRDGVDRVVRLLGSIIVALTLGGLVLNLLPDGLTRQTWSAFWALISLVVLWFRRRDATSFEWMRKSAGAQTAWFGASAAVLIFAAVIAVQGANKDLTSPVQMWVAGQSAGAISVAVSSGSADGPYRFVVSPEVTRTNAFDPFTVDAGAPVERSIPVAGDTRYDIHLVEVSSGTIVRTVIVDSPPIL